jgi:hypothetical protein
MAASEVSSARKRLHLLLNTYLRVYEILQVLVFTSVSVIVFIGIYYYDYYYYYYYYYRLLTRVFLVFLSLNHWCTSPLRLQSSDCSTFLSMCHVPRMAVLQRICGLLAWYSSYIPSPLVTVPMAPMTAGITKIFHVPHSLNFCT